MTEAIKTIKSQKKGRLEKILNYSILNKALFIFIIIIGIYYLVLANNLAVKGFKLRELQKKASLLRENNEELANNKIKLESYQSLNQRIKLLGMVKANKIEYLTLKAGIVAKR